MDTRIAHVRSITRHILRETPYERDGIDAVIATITLLVVADFVLASPLLRAPASLFVITSQLHDFDVPHPGKVARRRLSPDCIMGRDVWIFLRV